MKNYKDSFSKKIPQESVNMFNDFISNELKPTHASYHCFKKMARRDEYHAFVCGSDQIWSSTSLYVDPFYYLRFAPDQKRVAFAPSFGKDFVPDYNRKKIAKYISEIKCKSVRETSGAEIVENLTGEAATVLIDPTLVLSAAQWSEKLNLSQSNDQKYLLAYFLDKPSEKAVQIINDIARIHELQILYLPYESQDLPWHNAAAVAGPREFVEYINNAKWQ